MFRFMAMSQIVCVSRLHSMEYEVPLCVIHCTAVVLSDRNFEVDVGRDGQSL